MDKPTLSFETGLCLLMLCCILYGVTLGYTFAIWGIYRDTQSQSLSRLLISYCILLGAMTVLIQSFTDLLMESLLIWISLHST